MAAMSAQSSDTEELDTIRQNGGAGQLTSKPCKYPANDPTSTYWDASACWQTGSRLSGPLLPKVGDVMEVSLRKLESQS